MKKVLISLIASVVLIVGTVIVSYNVSAENQILLITEDKITLGSNVLLNIDLSKIEYTKSNIKIYSSSELSNVYQNNINNINVDNNEIEFTFDKTTSNINNAIFEIKLSDKVSSNSEVTFKIVVTNLEDETSYFEEEQKVTIIEKETTTTQVQPQNNNETNNNNTNTNQNNNSNSTKSMNTKSVSAPSNANTSSSQTMQSEGMNTQNANVYNGSTNNYLKKLSVSGYSFTSDFKKEITSYFMTVGSDVDKITVKASADSSSATVQVSGNTSLKTGMNKVLITVTSKSGSIRYYRIYVTKE